MRIVVVPTGTNKLLGHALSLTAARASSVTTILRNNIITHWHVIRAHSSFGKDTNTNTTNNNNDEINKKHEHEDRHQELFQHERPEVEERNQGLASPSSPTPPTPPPPPQQQQQQQRTRRHRRGYWHDPATHRQFFDWLAREVFNIKHLDDWYNITAQQVAAQRGGGVRSDSDCSSSSSSRGRSRGRSRSRKSGGSGSALLNGYYGGSLVRALLQVYPEHPWNPTRFVKVPQGFWRDIANQRLLFDSLARDHFNIKHLDEWYNVTVEQVRAAGGGVLVRTYYGDSLLRALRAIYPEHPWRTPDPAPFPKAPVGHWKDINNQRQLFDRIAQELGLDSGGGDNNWEGWYRVSLQDVQRRGGAGLLSKFYKNSLARALQAIYPERPWQEWRFRSTAASSFSPTPTPSFSSSTFFATPSTCASDDCYSNNNNNNNSNKSLADYIAALAKELDVKHLDDWYRVSTAQIRNFGGYRMISRNGGLPMVLKRLYPQHMWDEKRFSSTGKKAKQRKLLLAIKELFPAMNPSSSSSSASASASRGDHYTSTTTVASKDTTTTTTTTTTNIIG